ncbi:MAG TPA: prepilin-type N-terminal cleavage/methylation domain-containing protein [Chroococcidiopsis sp.]
MAKHSLIGRLKRAWYVSHKRKAGNAVTHAGFTLLELLVVTVISGGIIAGLTYMVVELLGADQRESSRAETQREMQMSLDYISSELQEAVYVYPGACLQGNGAAGGTACHGLFNYIPDSISTGGSVPVLAFWKQQPYPRSIKEGVCRTSPYTATVSGQAVSCISGNSYALVIYSLSNANASGLWKGRARITRYALTEFQQNGTRTKGYVNPGSFSNNFDTWPYGPDPSGSTVVNLQTLAAIPGRPDGAAQVLVDFVDDGSGATALGIPNAADNLLCPDDASTVDNPATTTEDESIDYVVSPPAALQTAVFGARPRGFYACVSTGSNTGENREVVLFVRGNAYGRGGIVSDKGFLPTLETRVLSRAVLDRSPSL